MNFIKKFLNLFTKTKTVNTSSLPKWEEVVEKCYGQEISLIPEYTVEKVIYTKAKDFRVILYKKKNKDMYFTIYEKLYAWDEEELQYGCDSPGYWCPTGENTSVFDTLETAEREVYSMPEFKF